MSNNYQKRKLNFDNMNEVRKIIKIHLAIPALWLNDYTFSEKEIQENIENLIKKSKSPCLYFTVLEIENKIVSYLWAERLESHPEIINIISLWTHKDYRRSGLAAFLKKDLEKWAENKNGINKIITTVSSKNKKMVELNKKMNYKISSYKMVKEIK